MSAYGGAPYGGAGVTLTRIGSVYVSDGGAATATQALFQYARWSDGTLTALSPDALGTGDTAQANKVIVSPDQKYAYLVWNGTTPAIYQYAINSDGSLTALSPASVAIGAGGQGWDAVVSPDGQYLWVTEHDVSEIHVYTRDRSTGKLTIGTTVAGGGIANDTREICVSPDGRNLYVANAASADIASFSLAGGVPTFQNTRAAGTTPRCPVVSHDGENLYAADQANGVILEYTRNGIGALTALGTIAAADSPVGLAVSPDGKHVYCCGTTDNVIYMYSRDATTGVLTALAPASVANPTGGNGDFLTVSADGTNVYSTGTGVVTQFKRDTTTGLLTALSPASAAQALTGFFIAEAPVPTASPGTASDSLGLSDTALVHNHFSGSASDSLAISDTATAGGHWGAGTSDSLGISDSAHGSVSSTAHAGDSISFSDAPMGSAAYGAATSDSISLSDGTRSGVGAADSIAFSDTAFGYRYLAMASDTITYGDATIGVALPITDLPTPLELDSAATTLQLSSERSSLTLDGAKVTLVIRDEKTGVHIDGP